MDGWRRKCRFRCLPSQFLRLMLRNRRSFVSPERTKIPSFVSVSGMTPTGTLWQPSGPKEYYSSP